MATTAPIPLTDLRAARDALAALRDAYETRYGAVVFDVTADSRADGLALGGTVLLPAQRTAALAAVREATGGSVADEVVALTESRTQQAWLLPGLPVRDIRQRPAPDSPLSTQVLAGDPPVRLLAEVAGWWAVELADGTVGWTEPEHWEAAGAGAPADPERWRLAWRGACHPAGEADWRQALAMWWGTPYRWGGNAPAGIDCSGLTQRVVKAATGLGLPKHSADQLRQGARVGLAEVATGDLVGLTHVERGIGHIGIVLGMVPPTLAHASLELGVAEEPLPAVLERYRFRAARRLAGGSGA